MSRLASVVALTAFVACQTFLTFGDEDAAAPDASVDASDHDAPVAPQDSAVPPNDAPDAAGRCAPICKRPQDQPCSKGSECRSGVCTGAKCAGGLVLYYAFDEAPTEVSIVDWSPSKLNGVRELGTLGVPGRAGTAFDTRGASLPGFVKVVHDSRTNPPQMTISVWATRMPDAQGGTTAPSGVILQKSSTNNWNDGYGVTLKTDGVSLFAWTGYFEPTNPAIYFPTGPNFHHVVVTWNGTTLRLYVDKALVGAQDRPGAAFQPAAPLLIGSGYAYSLEWEGAIDELRIFDRVLAPDEMTQLYEDP